ncbi:MAG: hypothetical protein JW981_08775 [Anaerolineae bacterium]|nr:hypothetical protein [Anaerolineae bacterium]
MYEEHTFQKENFTIRYGEANTFGNATMATICTYFQETAFNHNTKLIKLITGREKIGYAIVLTQMQIVMQRLPCWLEQISILSWIPPIKENARFLDRYYQVYDAQNNEIGYGLGSIVLFDLEQRATITIPDEIWKFPVCADNVGNGKIARTARLKRKDVSKGFNVHHSDIDMYRHVNNVHYINWAMDSLPAEITDDWQCYEMSVRFRDELREGESVTAYAQIDKTADEITVTHAIYRQEDNIETTRLATTWKRGNYVSSN